MKKYDNFCSALENLGDIFNYTEPYDNVILTGLVGLFEVCFEQSWKMMKELLNEHGIEEGATSSPKIILKTAYASGILSDEKLWLAALQARNNVAHSYNKSVALDIVRQTKSSFYAMFLELKDAVQTWL